MGNRTATGPTRWTTTLACVGTFAGVWLLWSGHFSPLLLVLGAVSCALVTWLSLAVGFPDVVRYGLVRGRVLVRFWAWLTGQIVTANVSVARIMWRLRPNVSPVWITLNVADLGPIDRATLANAITLTPGTLSVGFADDRLEVHCLDPVMADELEAGHMQRRLSAPG